MTGRKRRLFTDSRWKITLGRLTIWAWAGGRWWMPVDHLRCWHCRNIYFGPIGFEWEKRLPQDDEVATIAQRVTEQDGELMGRLGADD